MNTKENILKIDVKFYLMYYSLIISLLLHCIMFYYLSEQTSSIIIIGLILVVSLVVFSLCTILAHCYCITDEDASRLMFMILYISTGLVIIFTEPGVIGKFSDLDNSYTTINSYNIFVYLCIGSKSLIKNRCLYYIISYFIVSLYSSLAIFMGSIKADVAVTYAIMCIFVFFQGESINIGHPNYNIIVTENNLMDYNSEQAKTPLDEIVLDIKHSIDKAQKTSSTSSPKTRKIYEKFEKTLSSILKKIQNSNLYSSRLELITKHMDNEDKLYIEQGFFDSYGSSINYMPDNVQPKKIIEYNMSELVGFLSHIGKEWSFNTFFIAECSHAPIRLVGEYSIKLYRLNELIVIPDPILMNFLTALEENYLENPYHNSCHGADVLCSYMYLISNTGIPRFMNSLEWLGGIVASMAHDLGHPAVNNRYLIITKHEFAIMYNDISVLENMHASMVFRILGKAECNILEALNAEKMAQIRKLIIDMILATDMGKHFDLVSYIRVKYSESIDLSNVDSRHDMFKLFIKAADIGHAAKALELHQRWCGLVIQEFFAQGDLEKGKGLPVSMFCDRETTVISKAQVGFIKNIVLILYETMISIVGSEEIEKQCIRQLKTNLKYWENYKTLRVKSVNDTFENIPSLDDKNDKRISSL